MKNLSDYSEFSLTELIDKISTSRYWNLPKMLAEALRRLIPQEPKYKVYTALLTQSGTDAPVSTVLENTLGGDIVWTRIDVGLYLGTLEGVFTVDKTFLPNPTEKTDPTSGVSVIQVAQEGDPNYVIVGTAEDGSQSDNILQNYSLEIRVYN